MSKIDLKRLDSVTANDTTATALINDNFKTLQDAIENSLSRDGSTPNFMDADLDMNSYKIINSGEAVDDNDVVNLKYVKESIGGAVQAAQDASDSAAKAASSAQSALVSASNAAAAVRNAETTITQATALLEETQEYVDTAKADIDAIVAQGKADIDQYVTDAEEEVKQIARDEANKAIENAAAEATQIATDNINTYYNDTIKPELDSSVASASASATAAAESASKADVDADNAAESAGLAQNSATAAANYLNELTTTATDSFNSNAANKQAQVDASAANAVSSASSAAKSAEIALEAATKAAFGNIGDIKYTSRTDVPNGGAWCDGALYTKAQFPDVYQMLVDGKINNLNFTQYQKQIADFGFCETFALDTSNEKFKVPTVNHFRKLVKQETIGDSWYKWYDDGWLEQGGEINQNSSGGWSVPITFLKKFADTNYIFFVTSGFNGYTNEGFNYYNSKTEESINAVCPQGTDFKAIWKACGYGAIPDTTTRIKRNYIVLYSSAAEASEVQAAEFINALTNKANTDLSNVPSNIDYVVESYRNGTEWYKIYKSGWVEQGGRTEITIGDITVNFLVPYSEVPYVFKTGYTDSLVNYQQRYSAAVFNVTTESFQTGIAQQETGQGFWRAEGQGASE